MRQQLIVVGIIYPHRNFQKWQFANAKICEYLFAFESKSPKDGKNLKQVSTYFVHWGGFPLSSVMIEWVKYEWNGSPQPHMVGFHNLVGTGIALVSKKNPTVKC